MPPVPAQAAQHERFDGMMELIAVSGEYRLSHGEQRLENSLSE